MLSLEEQTALAALLIDVPWSLYLPGAARIVECADRVHAQGLADRVRQANAVNRLHGVGPDPAPVVLCYGIAWGGR